MNRARRPSPRRSSHCRAQTQGMRPRVSCEPMMRGVQNTCDERNDENSFLQHDQHKLNGEVGDYKQCSDSSNSFCVINTFTTQVAFTYACIPHPLGFVSYTSAVGTSIYRLAQHEPPTPNIKCMRRRQRHRWNERLLSPHAWMNKWGGKGRQLDSAEPTYLCSNCKK